MSSEELPALYCAELDYKQAETVADLAHTAVDMIIGPQMEVIESLGLPEKQENAVKNLLKSKAWSGYDWFIGSVDYQVKETDRKKLGQSVRTR